MSKPTTKRPTVTQLQAALDATTAQFAALQKRYNKAREKLKAQELELAKRAAHAEQDDQVLDSCGDVMADMNARYSDMRNTLEALELETSRLRDAYGQDQSTIQQLRDAVRRLQETETRQAQEVARLENRLLSSPVP